jgi:hypothetical protein
MTSVGLSLALRRYRIAALFAVCQGAAYTVVGTCHSAVAAIAAASCVFTSAQLARHVTPGDVERSVVLALLAGNAATFVLMALFGVDNAYANDVVLTSNNLTHAAITGLVLWATRR